MTVKCHLVLNSPLVYAGTIVSGTVYYEIHSQETFQTIELVISGKANFKSPQKYIDKSETFFEVKNIMYGMEDGSLTKLSPNYYTYRFSVTVPLNSPSSYKYHETLCHIKSDIEYFVKVIRNKSFLSVYTDAEKEFTVVKYYDLNFVPGIEQKVEVNINKNRFWLFNVTRPAFIKFCLTQRGFVPGTKIPFTLDCNNLSANIIENITVYLYLTIKYNRLTSKDPKGYEETNIDPTLITLSKVLLGSVNVNEAKAWNEYILIPNIQALHSDGCKLINLEYIIYIEAKFPFPHRSLTTQIPIVLGDKSLNSDNQLRDRESNLPDQFPFIIVKDLTDIHSRYETTREIFEQITF